MNDNILDFWNLDVLLNCLCVMWEIEIICIQNVDVLWFRTKRQLL